MSWKDISWKELPYFNDAPHRIQLRRKTLLALSPLLLILTVLIVKFVMLKPASQQAQTEFDQDNSPAVDQAVKRMKFLYTVQGYIPEFAHGDSLMLQRKFVEANASFEQVLHSMEHPTCPIYVNLLLVKEALADQELEQAHFTNSMNYDKAILTLIAQAPTGCLTDSHDTKDERKQYLNNANARISRKLHQVDQGALRYTEENKNYSFYYLIGNNGRLLYPGNNNPCAGKEDIPKKECIISHSPPMQMPAHKHKTRGQNNNPNPNQFPEKTQEAKPPKIDRHPEKSFLHPDKRPPKDVLGDYISQAENKSHIGS